MTPDQRTKVLSHIQKLEFNGHWEMASILRSVLVDADLVPELRETVAALRTPPVGTGGTE